MEALPSSSSSVEAFGDAVGPIASSSFVEAFGDRVEEHLVEETVGPNIDILVSVLSKSTTGCYNTTRGSMT